MKIDIRKASLLMAFIMILGFLTLAQDARTRYELLNLIRKEKFDKILPGAMRDNKVDMWIHVIKRGDPDPLALDLGGSMGYFVFTDNGGDRIHRALLGVSFAAIADESIYDQLGAEKELTKLVAKRDPRRIAVNMSTWLTVADGLSHTGYLKLCKLLGENYAKRLISSENVITDFRVRRVQTEIIAFARACEIQRKIMEAALKNIRPGITSREDIGWWAQDQLLTQGLQSSLFGAGKPGVTYSEVSSRSQTRKSGYAFQPGDFISWDWGIKYLNFGTDYKRKAYILKKGETSPPSGLIHAWERGLKAREIIRKTFKPGLTVKETLDLIARAMGKAGFVYTPFVDTPKDRDIVNALGKSKKSGYSIDCHCVGNTGNSEVAVGPSLAPFREDRYHLKIQPNNLIAFEFIVHTWVPEWGRRLPINFEDNAIVTERGIEALYPRNEKIILIR